MSLALTDNGVKNYVVTGSYNDSHFDYWFREGNASKWLTLEGLWNNYNLSIRHNFEVDTSRFFNKGAGKLLWSVY